MFAIFSRLTMQCYANQKLSFYMIKHVTICNAKLCKAIALDAVGVGCKSQKITKISATLSQVCIQHQDELVVKIVIARELCQVS